MVRGVGKRGCGRGLDGGQSEGGGRLHGADAAGVGDVKGRSQKVAGPDPRKVDTSGVSYAALVSVAEFSASKTSGAERLHQECRRRVL